MNTLNIPSFFLCIFLRYCSLRHPHVHGLPVVHGHQHGSLLHPECQVKDWEFHKLDCSGSGRKARECHRCVGERGESSTCAAPA
jgi:hypothetical protein